MDVMPEYQQTGVRAIPDGWVLRALGDTGKWFSGGTPSLSNPAYWSGDIPWISAKDMKVSRLWGGVDHISARAVSDGAKVLPKGAILIVTRGMILAHSFPVARVECALSFNQDLKALVTADGIDSTFLLYWLLANSKRILSLTTDSTHGTKRLPTEMLSRELVALPPTKTEQEAIAAALSDADALIESLEQLLDKKRHLKQGAMQELLSGKKRLPGFGIKAGFKQTEVGVIPEDWEVKRLGEIGEALIGLTYKPADVRPDGILVLRSSNVQDDSLRFDDNVFVETEVPGRIMVKPGDILICVRNGSRNLIGKCARIDGRAEGMTFGAFMAVFRSPFCALIFHQFRSSIIKRQIHEHLGATINQITNKSLNSFVIPLPPREAEQEEIAAILSEMDAEIAMLEAKLEKARSLKRGMMQELLTGRIRLI